LVKNLAKLLIKPVKQRIEDDLSSAKMHRMATSAS